MSESYEDAVRGGTVTELPGCPASAVAPPPQSRCTAYDQILDDLDARLSAGRFDDDNPPGTPARWTPA